MAVVRIVGSPTSLSWRSSDDAAAALAVTKPDGTVLTPALTVTDSTTTHTAALTPTLPGRYRLLWSTAGDKHADVLDVWPEDPHYLVSRADALERLGQSSDMGYARYDALMLYIAAASAVIESITGPLIASSRTWTEVPPYTASSIVLPHENIVVTAVTVDGAALAAGDYIVDEDAGIVSALSGPFLPLTKVTVSYTAGGQQIPAQARLACLELVAHMWQGTREALRPETPGEDVQVTSIGYALPKRVLELLATMPRAAGVA